MRNLKKILALVLALMMVLSVMVTASAADFTDAGEIDYTEAVEVMAAIGMLEGYNGAFNPKGTLTREGAAKLIAYALLGKSASSVLAQGTETGMADVPASHWASGYIAWCVENGYINGYNGKYDPSGTLTGYGWAKLLLCALGVEGTYTGNTWTLDVAINAKKIGLLNGLGNLALSADITREQASQMALNALTVKSAPEAWYVYDTTAKVVVGTYDSLVDATMYATFLNGTTDASTGTRYQVKEVAVDYLLNDVHGMSVNDDARDLQGRPGTLYTWTVSGLPALFVADAPVFSSENATVANKDLYAGLTPVGYTVVINDWYVDGVNVLDGTQDIFGDAALDTSYSIVNNTSAYKNGKVFGDLGASLEVFATDIPGYYDVVMCYDYEGHVYKTNAGVDAAGVTYHLIGTWDNDLGDDNYIVGNQKYYEGEFDEDIAFGYNENLIVTIGWDGTKNVICTAKRAEVITGTATWTSANREYVTIEGKTYAYSPAMDMYKDGDFDKVSSTNITNKMYLEATLDTYGNVVNVYVPNDYSNFAVVTKTHTYTDKLGEDTDYARLVFANGTVDVVKYYNLDTVANGSLVTYYTVGDVYMLSDVSDNETVDKGAFIGQTADNLDGWEIFTNNTLVHPTNSVLGNENTVFIVETIKNSVKTYAVYTGIQNVPNVLIDGYDAVINGSGNDKGYADVVWMYNAKPANHGDSSKLIYVSALSKDEQTQVDRGTYYRYDVIVGGKITTMDIVMSQTVGTGFWATAKTDDKGLVTLEGADTIAAPYSKVTGTSIEVESYGNTIKLSGSNTYYYTTDTVVFVDFGVYGGGIVEMSVADFDSYYESNYKTWDVTALAISNVLTTIIVHP